MILNETAGARFWTKVDKNGPIPESFPELGACHLWTARKDRYGYGVFRTGGKGTTSLGAHRVLWVMTYGPLLPIELVCHKCDVRSCVNLKHLFVGSCADNSADMVAKGRSAKGPANARYGKPFPGRSATYEERARGERSGTSRFTEQDVREMRARAAMGEQQKSIAKSFNCHQAVISGIVRRVSWKHVI